MIHQYVEGDLLEKTYEHALQRTGAAVAELGDVGKNIPMQLCVWYDESMPTVLRIGSFRFHFYTDEGSGPPHIHVRTPDGDCKFWLEPSIFLQTTGA